jgi:cell fate (sporulation/competence/biofilm development) regulator YmcA (YheA/YmcA/DUF963 family)
MNIFGVNLVEIDVDQSVKNIKKRIDAQKRDVVALSFMTDNRDAQDDVKDLVSALMNLRNTLQEAVESDRPFSSFHHQINNDLNGASGTLDVMGQVDLGLSGEGESMYEQIRRDMKDLVSAVSNMIEETDGQAKFDPKKVIV